MAEGDLDSVLSIYDPEAVFVNESGEVKKGKEELREVLAPLAAARAVFEFNIRRVVRSGDIALMHTDWQVSSPQPMFVYAIEVARRQQAGVMLSVSLRCGCLPQRSDRRIERYKVNELSQTLMRELHEKGRNSA